LVLDFASCIIRWGAEAASTEFWQGRKIPLPSSLDGRVGRRSPSEARNISDSYKLDAENARAVVLPSPRNPDEKPIEKQRALVVLFAHYGILKDHSPGAKRPTRACGRFGLGLKWLKFVASDPRRLYQRDCRRSIACHAGGKTLLSRGHREEKGDCFGATSPALKTAIPSRPSKR
jgi:hypothetical protein